MSRPWLPLPGQKQCLNCQQIKPCSEDRSLSGFTLMKQKAPNGNIYRRYCSYCKACEMLRRDRWSRAHPARQKEWEENYKRDHPSRVRATKRASNARLRIRLVKQTVCFVYDLTPLQLLQRSRSSDDWIMEARCVALYALCVQGRMGPTMAGRALNLEHATVLHHIDRLKAHKTYEEAWAIREVHRLLGEHRHKTHPGEVPESFYQRRRAANG